MNNRGGEGWRRNHLVAKNDYWQHEIRYLGEGMFSKPLLKREKSTVEHQKNQLLKTKLGREDLLVRGGKCMSGDHKIIPRWGQPLTGIISLIVFTAVAWVCWYVFASPKGIFKLYEHPFLVFLAWMILFGLWQHIIFGDWPFQNLKPLTRGLVMTAVNIAGVYFIIYGVFHNFLGKFMFPFWSPEAMTEVVKKAVESGGFVPKAFAKAVAGGQWTPTVHEHVYDIAHEFAGSSITMVVLIGFFTYAFWSILFQKWPFAGKLSQPALGFAEWSLTTTVTAFFYGLLIFPFFGNVVFGQSFVAAFPWWNVLDGTPHLNYVVGFYEWAIIYLFFTANIWEGNPWNLVKSQPWRGIFGFVSIFIMAWATMKLSVWGMELYWGPVDAAAKDGINSLSWRYYNAANLAGFTLIPFLLWNHYFDNWPKQFGPVVGWMVRTVGVFAFAALIGKVYYLISEPVLGLTSHLGNAGLEGHHPNKPLVWLFWWIIPLLFNDWFMHKAPFYVEEKAASAVQHGVSQLKTKAS